MLFAEQTSPLQVRPLLVDCYWVANSPEMANIRASTLTGGIARESQEGRIKLAVRRSAATFSVSPQSEAQLVNWLRRAELLSSVGRAQHACCHPVLLTVHTQRGGSPGAVTLNSGSRAVRSPRRKHKRGFRQNELPRDLLQGRGVELRGLRCAKDWTSQRGSFGFGIEQRQSRD